MTRAKDATVCGRPSCSRQVSNYGYCEKHKRYYVAVGYVDAAVVRDHIRALRESGHSLNTLVEATGLSRAALAPRKNTTFRAEAARKILAVPIPDVWPDNSKAHIPNVGVRRRIQALRAMGYPIWYIADVAGVSKQAVQQWASHDHVTAATARIMDSVFRQLSMTPGPSDRSRAQAKRLKFAPPLAWNDIDDPDEKPNVGVHKPVSAVERIAEVRELGISSHERIAEILKIQPDSVERALARAQAS